MGRMRGQRMGGARGVGGESSFFCCTCCPPSCRHVYVRACLCVCVCVEVKMCCLATVRTEIEEWVYMSGLFVE